jgi:hypothetical protein
MNYAHLKLIDDYYLKRFQLSIRHFEECEFIE